MKIIVVGCCLALFSCNAQHDEAPQEPFNVNSNLRGNVEGAKIEESPIVQPILDSAICFHDRYFDTIELPIELDMAFFKRLISPPNKVKLPVICVYDDYEDGDVTFIRYAWGKFLLDDGTELYLTLKGRNPDNPMDGVFEYMSVFTLEEGGLVNELIIAKYHAYSRILEEYYCTISSDGTIDQRHEHTIDYEDYHDVASEGDTTYQLQELISAGVESVTANELYEDRPRK
jgi:hypothetical protein